MKRTAAPYRGRSTLERQPESHHYHAELNEPVLVVSVNRSYPRRSAYDAARYAWRLSPARAKLIRYVLATKNRRIIGVFEPLEWKAATTENFPEFAHGMPGRIGFVGRVPDEAVSNRYVGRDLPSDLQFSGNGYRYAGAAENS